MLSDHKFIVFALDHYNPLGMIRTLGENGIAPIYIAVKHRIDLGVKSKYVSCVHKVDSVEEGYRILLKEYGNEKIKPFLLTSDDRTTGYLDEKYDELKDKFILFNAGEAGRITEFMDKEKVLELAKKHGLKVLDTRVLNKGEIPADLDYPIITKSISPNVGGWKSDVHICKSKEELEKAYETIESPLVLVQKFIEKKNEFCLDGFSANKGKDFFVGIASTYKYLIPGYYSPYMDVFNFTNEEMRKSLNSMMEEIGFEGVFSIEFLIDEYDNYWFCEINFRNSTWSYASTVAGMPLAYLWARTMLEGKIPEDAEKVIPEGFTAMVEPIDYSKRIELGLCTPGEWLADFKKTNCGFYYSADDLEPFYEMVRNWDKLS
ncbi:MAG: hypothetical protein ACLRS1_07045 [Oscillospiraceae bacterium]